MTKEELIQEFDGLYKTYYETGLIKEIGEFKLGLLTGEYKSFDENGYLVKRYNYLEGERNGICEDFKEGILIDKQKYINGEIDHYFEKGDLTNFKPDCIVFLNRNSNNKKKHNVIDTSKRLDLFYNKTLSKYFEEDFNYLFCGGKLTSYYSTGELKEEFRVNQYTLYWRNGNIMERDHFNDEGHLHGVSEIYYSNGILKKRVFFVNGTLDGVFTSYYLNGVKASEGTYKNGEIHGLQKDYYRNGNKKNIFLKDLKKSKFSKIEYLSIDEKYYSDGQLYYKDIVNCLNIELANFYPIDVKKYERVRIYKIDNLIANKYYFDINNSAYNLEIEYFENLQVRKITFEDSSFILFDSENKFSFTKYPVHVYSSEAYNSEYHGELKKGNIHLNNNQIGDFKNYYENGTLKEFGTYSSKGLQGKYVRYHKNGEKQFEAVYENNIITQYNLVYDKFGKIVYKFEIKKKKIINNTNQLIDPTSVLDNFNSEKELINDCIDENEETNDKNKFIDINYHSNNNISSKIYFPEYDSPYTENDENPLIEKFSYEGLLIEKKGFPSPKRIAELNKKDELENQFISSQEDYYDYHEIDYSMDNTCPACQENPCMCSISKD